DFLVEQRLECPGPNVECNLDDLNPIRAQARQQRLIKVQSCCRGCYRSRVPREYGLVALAVGGVVGAMYIRRKRDMAAALEERVHGVAIGQLEKPRAIAFPAPERHASSACNIEHVSRSQFLSGFRPRHEVVIITFVEKEDFEFLGAGGALAKHPRWNDACPV